MSADYGHLSPHFPVGWSPTSGTRMSGTSKPSLGHEVLTLGFDSSTKFPGKLHSMKDLGTHLEVPYHLFLPDIGDQPILDM